MEPEEDLRGLRILIVEDEPMLAFIFKAFLEDIGAHVIGPANSVQAAFRLLESEKFDCALTDVQLNEETVFDFAKQLQIKEIPFAFVTGNNQKAMPTEFQKIPILLKPINFSQLPALVRQVIAPMTTKTPESSLPSH